MDCFKSWLPKWLKNNFISAAGKPVKNAPLIRYLSALLDDRAQNGHKVRLQYIKGHAGHEGNEGADRLAGQGAEMPEVEERDWQELEKALRAEKIPRHRGEVEVADITDGELEVYAEGLLDEDQLLNDLEMYAEGVVSDEQVIRDLAE
jgi:ribonuclease HI